MYILIDNYDSFTYNIYQYLTEITDTQIEVCRNDEISIDEIDKKNPEAIFLSPGPGRPENAGICLQIVKTFSGKYPILGICLGHQVIAEAFGAKIIQADKIVHGKTEQVQLDGKGIFRNIKTPSEAVRYHSLAVDKKTLPDVLEISAHSKDGEIMGIRHMQHITEGIQFHPESIGSEDGKQMLKNFINYKRIGYNPKPALLKIIKGSNLESAEAEAFMDDLTSGNLSPVWISAILTGLNSKGITADEIAGCAAVLQRKRVVINKPDKVLDTCGTGGDGSGSFNISSFTALITASCGIKVAKHGNKAVSSISGSADFYSCLGIPLDLSPDSCEKLLERTGFTFLYAPHYHSAMRFAGPVRSELGIKTIMNLLGPLVNPAGADYQLIGVFDEKFCIPMAQAAHKLGVKNVMTVHSMDGLDEISLSAPTKIVKINAEGKMDEFLFEPSAVGLQKYPKEALKGGTGKENAETAMEILRGNGSEAIREAVLINSGAALFISNQVQSIIKGYEKAKEALESGKTLKKLEEIIMTAQELNK